MPRESTRPSQCTWQRCNSVGIYWAPGLSTDTRLLGNQNRMPSVGDNVETWAPSPTAGGSSVRKGFDGTQKLCTGLSVRLWHDRSHLDATHQTGVQLSQKPGPQVEDDTITVIRRDFRNSSGTTLRNEVCIKYWLKGWEKMRTFIHYSKEWVFLCVLFCFGTTAVWNSVALQSTAKHGISLLCELTILFLHMCQEKSSTYSKQCYPIIRAPHWEHPKCPSTRRRTQNVAYSHNGTQHPSEDQWATAVCIHMDESQKHTK